MCFERKRFKKVNRKKEYRSCGEEKGVYCLKDNVGYEEIK